MGENSIFADSVSERVTGLYSERVVFNKLSRERQEAVDGDDRHGIAHLR